MVRGYIPPGNWLIQRGNCVKLYVAIVGGLKVLDNGS
jgi:hypothetical protein